MKFQALLLSFVLMTYSPAVIGQENQCIASIKKNCLYKNVKDFFAATRISPDLREIDPHTYKQISTNSELLKQNTGHKTVYYSLAHRQSEKGRIYYLVVQQFGDYGGEYILLTLDAAGVLIDELVVAQNILTKEQNVIIESKLENHRISQTITANVFSGGIETISRTYSISDEGKIIFVD